MKYVIVLCNAFDVRFYIYTLLLFRYRRCQYITKRRSVLKSNVVQCFASTEKRHLLAISEFNFLTNLIENSAVFTWTNLLVVVAELDGAESEALDLVPLITNTVLEEHHLIVGIVVVADPGTVPINSRGEKQRMHLRDGFLADQLDPIYVAYNM